MVIPLFHHQVMEWQNRAEKFEDMCCSVMQMFTRLSNSANRTILYDLYTYMWDIKSIVSMVKSFVQWLGMYESGPGPAPSPYQSRRPDRGTSSAPLIVVPHNR